MTHGKQNRSHKRGDKVNLILWLWFTDSQISSAWRNSSPQGKGVANQAGVIQFEWLTEVLGGYLAPCHWLGNECIKRMTFGWLVAIPLTVTIRWSLLTILRAVPVFKWACTSTTSREGNKVRVSDVFRKRADQILQGRTHMHTYVSTDQLEVHILSFPIKIKMNYMPCSFHRSYPAFRRDPELAQAN